MVIERIHPIVSIVSIACLWLLLAATVTAQKSKDPRTGHGSVCDQTLQFKHELMERIEPLEYTFRRIEFSGNVSTRDKVLRKHLSFGEGDLFTRTHLVGSIKRLS